MNNTDPNEEQPASQKDVTVLMEKMVALEKNIAEMQNKAIDERLDKLEQTADDILKALHEATEDAGEDVEGTEDDKDEKGESKKKVPKGEKKTSNYSGDGEPESTKGKPEEKSTEADLTKVIEDLKAKVARLEKGQAVIKGAASDDITKGTGKDTLRLTLAKSCGMVR